MRQFSVLNELSHVWGQKGLRDLHMYVFCITINTTGTSNRISSTFLCAPASADKSIPIRNQPSAAFLPRVFTFPHKLQTPPIHVPHAFVEKTRRGIILSSAFVLIGSEWNLIKKEIGSVPFLAMAQSRLRTGGSRISNNGQQKGEVFGAVSRFWQVGSHWTITKNHLLIISCSDHMSPTMSALQSSWQLTF